MATREMTLDDVVSHVVKEVEKKVSASFDSAEGRAVIAAEINKTKQDLEQKYQSEVEAERKRTTALEEAVEEMRQRLSRKEKLDRDNPLHVDRNGQVRPGVTRECGDHLINLCRAQLGRKFDGEKSRVLSAGTDSEGGYLVAPEFAAEILRLIPTVGLYRRVARIVPMKTDEKNFGTLLSSFSTYWPAENAAITPSYPGFGQLKLTAKILAAYTEAPENLLDDAEPDLGQFLADLFIEAIAKEEDRVGFAGDAPTDAFDGALFISGANQKVQDATKTKTSDVTADYLLDLQTTVPDGAREDTAYFMSPTIFDAVRKLKDSQGNYIWQAPVAGAPGTIWGRPYFLSERFPAYSTSADASRAYVLYCNPKYLILGDRKAVAVKASDVAGDSLKKIQTAIRAHERIAVNSFASGIARLVTAAA